MAKENHDPITLNSAEIPSSKLPKTRQNSSANSVTTTNSSDLFDLLARCQSQRLDDQRCALPSYFSQVSWHRTLWMILRKGKELQMWQKEICQLKHRFERFPLMVLLRLSWDLLRPTQREFESNLCVPLFVVWEKKRNERFTRLLRKTH